MLEPAQRFPVVWSYSPTSDATHISTCTIPNAFGELGAAISIALVRQGFEMKDKSMENMNGDFNKFRYERRRVHPENS